MSNSRERRRRRDGDEDGRSSLFCMRSVAVGRRGAEKGHLLKMGGGGREKNEWDEKRGEIDSLLTW